MAGINVTIKPEIISWVLQTVQFENVASSAIELLNKWQSGEKTPTFNQVEDISKKTKKAKQSLKCRQFFLQF